MSYFSADILVEEGEVPDSEDGRGPAPMRPLFKGREAPSILVCVLWSNAFELFD